MKYISPLLLLLVIFLMAFKTIRQKQNGNTSFHKMDCMDSLKSDVKKYWHYNKTTKKYITKEVFISNLTNKHYPCLIGMDALLFYKIFGRENTDLRITTKWGALDYPTIPINRFSPGLSVIFDKQGKIIGVAVEERGEQRHIQE